MIRTRTTHAEVSWVGLQRIRHAARDTHELGQDQRAFASPLLRKNKLHRSGVHAVTKWGNDAEISNAEKRIELVSFYGLVTI